MPHRWTVFATVVAFASPALAGEPAPGRRVELILVRNEVNAAGPRRVLASAAAPGLFTLLTLPRNVAQVPATEPARGDASPLFALPHPRSGAAIAGTAAVAPIAVPGWMVPTPSAMGPFGPRCRDGDYRPSGILGQAAEQRRRMYFGLVRQIACEVSLPPSLLDALIIRESAYNPIALSPRFALGLTQLMPGTAAALGVNRHDVVDNLRGGARYLRQQLDRFGNYPLALAAYNAGPGRVVDRRIPPLAETRAYVAGVLANWVQLERGSTRVDTLHF